MQVISPENQVKQEGIPLGWFVLDEAWTTVVNYNERRAVVLLHPDVDDETFACYQRWGDELEFYLIGWVPSYEDAEEWMKEKLPSMLITSTQGIPIKGLY